MYVERRGNGLAVAGFVLALVGAVIGLVPLLFIVALICGVLGLVFSVIGWRAASTDPARGKRGLAITGTVLGVVAIALAFIGVAIVDDAVDDLDEDLEELERELENPGMILGAVRLVAGLAPAAARALGA